MPELIVGLGLRPGTSAASIVAAVRNVLGINRIGGLATIDRRASEPGLLDAAAELEVPIRTYTAAELAEVPVPHPDSRTLAAVGTRSVAEAAAILAAAGGTLVVPKTTIDGVVVAAALVET
ncbi:cobalt-precorrin 5A hydrolase [Nocardia tenerifensis]|uniref:Cobalt-precorrin 5A hydrolase n=1 Tax=Nocardia tenerifensis TaxID=228006 RepID=A0A318K0E7_9NOCA|nr:cobalamin biosynthesis protein [Nocardia tenerifensis]PXX63927.1 cobalt-precorrin 5A hydrolase [Nocardia tenerifensis]